MTPSKPRIVAAQAGRGAGKTPASVSEGSARRPFRSIEPTRPRLADEVYRQVLDAVLAGDLRPGERIVQDRIAQEINVSRTPVREALLHLEQEGILARAGAAGFTVRGISETEVRDIYQAREAIEGYAARLVAEQRSAASLKRIERTVEREESIAAGGVEEYFHANRRIHRSIVKETGNEYLLKSFDAIWNRGFSFRVFAAIDHADMDASPHEHAGSGRLDAHGSSTRGRRSDDYPHSTGAHAPGSARWPNSRTSPHLRARTPVAARCRPRCVSVAGRRRDSRIGARSRPGSRRSGWDSGRR